MDEQILDFLAEHFNEGAQQVCRRLRPGLLELRAAYRNARVDVDYGNEQTVAAYLLGYYYNYVMMAQNAIAAIAVPAGTVNALALCGGPAPEGLAIANMLSLGVQQFDLCVEVTDR